MNRRSIGRRSPPLLTAATTDDEVLIAVGAGDRAAFAALYDDTVGLVYGNVVRVLGDAPRSGEVTREVYVAVWHDAAWFDPARSTTWTWLLTRAHRHAVERARDDRDRVDRGAGVLSARSPIGAAEGEVGAAMGDLAHVERQVVELAYYGGYTYREIAALLDVAAEPTSRYLRIALLRLRNRLRG